MSTPLILIYDFPAGFEFVTLPVSPINGITSIDWGDGIINTTIPHTYASAGTYTVKIYGSGITDMTNVDSSQPSGKNTSAQYLTECTSFGNIGLTNLNAAFAYCIRLIHVPSTLPSQITVLTSTFSDSSYNSVEISGWNVSNVTNMSFMFVRSEFNQPLNSWNVSSVSNMQFMFYSCIFNQPLNNWNVSNVTNMELMFYDTPFNQNISAWNVSNVTNMNNMFQNAGLSVTNYDNLLNGWSLLTLQQNVNFESNLYYSANGTTARNVLINTYNWNLTGNQLYNNTILPLILVYNFPSNFVYTPPIPDTTNLSSIDWGDGTPANTVIPHTYTSAGTYTVQIYGIDVPQFSTYVESPYSFNTSSQYCTQCTSFGNIGLTSLSYAFGYCTSLTQVPTTLPSTVTSLNNCFQRSSYNGTDISNWNVSNVTGMSGMFMESPFNQNISSWDVSNVTTMARMFRNTPFNQPIGNWNVENVTTMFGMFNTSSFNQPIGNWIVENVTNMSAMFYSTPFNQDISYWNVSNVTNMAYMFYNTPFNHPLIWNVENVTDMSSMFQSASVFDQDISTWNVGNVTNMSGMFFGATAYDFPLTDWNVSKVTDMSYMFYQASNYNHPLNWNVSNVTNMSNMFYNALLFNQNISTWNVSKVTTMGNMFNGAAAFNSALNWNVGLVADMSYMFKNATAFNKPLNWNVSNVSTMLSMFEGASSFNQNINSWNVSNVTNMIFMFKNATVFNNPLNNWNVTNVVTVESMFENATAFNQDISDWNVINVLTMTKLFVLTSMSIDNYNKLLNKWSNLNVQPNVALITNGLIFTPVGEVGRNKLIQENNWNIQGDVLAPSNIYQSTNFNLTYYKNLSIGTIYDLYFFNIKVSSVTCTEGTSITFTNINTTLKGKIFITIATGETALFGGYLTTTILVCRPPVIIKPEYTFSEQVSSSDRVKQLKQQVINCNILN